MKAFLTSSLLVSLSLFVSGQAVCRASKAAFGLSCPGDCFECEEEHTHPEGNRDLSFSMETYFENLYAYAPANLGSSCGFVSLAMYLSFFDSFRNDAFVPESYERVSTAATQNQALLTSPGVQRLPLDYDPDIDDYNEVFSDYVDDNKNTDFQAHLIDLYATATNYVPPANGPDYPTRIGMGSYHYVLDALYGQGNVPWTTIYSTYFSSDPASQYAVSSMHYYVSQILSYGVPAIIHYKGNLNNPDEFYHSAIAYKIDQNELIHANTQLGPTPTDEIIVPNQLFITEVGYADVSYFAWNHSKNYAINGLKYCGCGQHVFHTFTSVPLPADPDSHNHGEDSSEGGDDLDYLGDTLYHSAHCACGYTKVERHFAFSTDLPTTICSACGANCSALQMRVDDGGDEYV